MEDDQVKTKRTKTEEDDHQERKRQRKLEKKLKKQERKSKEKQQEEGGEQEEQQVSTKNNNEVEEHTPENLPENLDSFESAKKYFPKISREMFQEVTQTFKTPTEIQAKTWGPTLSGKDVIGIAATGSGKTLSFVLPIIAKMMEKGKGSQKSKLAKPFALVLAPTRELCTQSYEVAQKACEYAKLGAAVTYGGTSRGMQLKTLQMNPVDFLVATPGRLMDFMESGDIGLEKCEFVVLDEADRMLDMGFEKDVRKILSSTNSKRQTLMFSATWPEAIRSIAKEFLDKDAVRITIGSDKLKANTSISQRVEVMTPRDKDERLFELLEENLKTIVFCLYKNEAERVQQMLHKKGYKATGVHGNKSQHDREMAVGAFSRDESNILVATDVASRGLDIKGVELVINYTFPLTIEDYVHRIGRTGRAGASGKSVTFFTEHDKARAGELQNILREANMPIPEALLRFGGTVKKKEHAMYGAHFKQDDDLAAKAPQITTFDDSDDE